MMKISFTDYLKDYLDFNNITNKDFANRIGISQKHLIDILAHKRALSSQIIDSISIVTSIPVDYINKMELNYRFEESIDNYLKKYKLTPSQYLNKFSYNYLIKNKWIDFIDVNNKIEIIKDILKYLRVKDPEKVYKIEDEVFFKSKNDKPELLLLWLEKCYREALKQKVKKYDKDNIKLLVNFIKEESSKGIFDEKRLVNEFNDKGIALVIQEDIPGSKIRGAFKVHKDLPSIYVTYKHNRIADIYFALLHELAHCKKDFNKAKGTSLISLDSDSENELLADKCAFNWMVDNDYYNSILNDSNYNIDEEINYPKCFVLYRLAKDNKINYSSGEYQKYNCLLNTKNNK